MLALCEVPTIEGARMSNDNLIADEIRAALERDDRLPHPTVLASQNDMAR